MMITFSGHFRDSKPRSKQPRDKSSGCFFWHVMLLIFFFGRQETGILTPGSRLQQNFRSGPMWLQPLSLEPSPLEIEEFHRVKRIMLASSNGSREVMIFGGREQREMRKQK